jgi:predicted XRE-type DNA-binding protein
VKQPDCDYVGMKFQSFENVWDAIERDPAEAASLKARSDLMIAIIKEENTWQVDRAPAADRMGIARDRLEALHKGEMDAFSPDDLVRLASRVGLIVKIDVRVAASP